MCIGGRGDRMEDRETRRERGETERSDEDKGEKPKDGWEGEGWEVRLM